MASHSLLTRNGASPSTLPSAGLDSALDVAAASAELESLTAPERVAWALEQIGDGLVLSSSFGAQAAVCLHMVTRQAPRIPVILIDTGYLFPETYRFIDELTERLELNLRVYRNPVSPAWQEARYGQLWTQGLKGIRRYNHMNKVEPMNRALEELGARGWISGLRRKQSATREKLGALGRQDGRVKIHPIVDWSDRDVFTYLKEHDLPYHPLRDEGYISIGDVHTSHKLTDGQDEANARFFGLTRECGLHQSGADYQI